jgi:hypothetical protein
VTRPWSRSFRSLGSLRRQGGLEGIDPLENGRPVQGRDGPARHGRQIAVDLREQGREHLRHLGQTLRQPVELVRPPVRQHQDLPSPVPGIITARDQAQFDQQIRPLRDQLMRLLQQAGDVGRRNLPAFADHQQDGHGPRRHVQTRVAEHELPLGGDQVGQLDEAVGDKGPPQGMRIQIGHGW